MSWRQTVGGFIAGNKKVIEDRDKDLKDYGYKIDADKMLVYRLDAKWRFEMELLDNSIDIEDRVKIKDADVEMIHKAWGRGADNPEWTIRYNAWQELKEFWIVYVNRRSPSRRADVVIEQEMEFPLPGKEDNRQKVVRTVKKSTAKALVRRLGADKVKVLQDSDPGAIIESSSAFPEQQREWFVRNFGEGTMLKCANALENWAWPALDVTAKSLVVLHGQAPVMGMQGRAGTESSSAPQYWQKPSDKQ